MHERDIDPKKVDNTRPRRAVTHDPPDWITTDQLETELYNAIMTDSAASPNEEDGNFAEMDEYFAGEAEEAEEDEAERRRSLLRLLGLIRPRLTDLLGGPPVKKCSIHCRPGGPAVCPPFDKNQSIVE